MPITFVVFGFAAQLAIRTVLEYLYLSFKSRNEIK